MLISRSPGPWAKGLRPRARDLMVSPSSFLAPVLRSILSFVSCGVEKRKRELYWLFWLTTLGGLFTVTLVLNDNDFAQLTVGKANAQQLFMKGKLKIKGNMMAASKLEPLLKKISPAKAKL